MKTCAFACPSAVHHTTHTQPPPSALDTLTTAAETSSCFHGSQKPTDTMPSIPLRRSTSLLPNCAFWRVIDASWTPKPDVSARVLWHVVVEVQCRCAQLTQSVSEAPEQRFVLVQTDAVAGISWGWGGSNARRLLDQRLGRKMMMISRLSGFWSTCGCICVSAQTY